MSSREWKRIKTSTHNVPKLGFQQSLHEGSEASEAQMMGFPIMSRRILAAEPSSALTDDTVQLALVSRLDGEVLSASPRLDAKLLNMAETLVALCALLRQADERGSSPIELELKDGGWCSWLCVLTSTSCWWM